MINFVLNSKQSGGLLTGALILTTGDKIDFMSITSGSDIICLEKALLKELLEKIISDIGHMGEDFAKQEYMRAVDNVVRIGYKLEEDDK
jgi:hypothetical protein